jgi:PAS domain S-box-containing protein
MASAVELVEFAARQMLREEAAVDALPTILGKLTVLFGCRVAVAFQQDAGQQLVVLAAHPRQAAADGALAAQLGALPAAHRDVVADGGFFRARLPLHGRPGAAPMSVLLAYPAPDAGRCLCAVALAGDTVRLTAEAGATARAVAAIVAAQIRRANDAAELAERQARARALFERSPYAIVATGADRRLVEFNPAAEELSGWSRAEVLGKKLADVLIPERDRAGFTAGTERYLESGDMAAFSGRQRLSIVRADRSERAVELTRVPITIDGQVHFCGFLRDISDLEQAHAALQESEERFRLMSQLAPVGIIQTDLNGTCTFANVRWCELTGLTLTQVVGADWSVGFHPDDVARLDREWRDAIARNGELRTDCRLRPTGTDAVWVHNTLLPIRDAAGRKCGYLSAFTNISERKRAEAEKERLLNAEREAKRDLADQTERLNSLIAVAIPGVLVADENGKVTQINRSFGDLFGLQDNMGEFVGGPVTGVVRRIKQVFADPGDFVRRTEAIWSARRPVAGAQLACSDGRTFQCDYWPVLVDGDYRGDMWLAWDVSERKELERQRERMLAAELAARAAAEQAQQRLAEQNAKLQELDEAKTQFLATMSHELRTPLTSIVSFTELILDDEHELTPETLSSLSVIQRNAERLLRLVGDLLLLSRLEAGVIPLDLAPVSIPDLVREAVGSASATAAERGIEVRASTAAGPPVKADQLRLYQVLDNLLSNAIKFSGQDGRVLVSASNGDQEWRIDVSDDGIGIPADELGQLFGRFVRASNARIAGLPGTGLGLSVVKAITELHGGRVEVRSAIGRGTTFSVYLPAGP